MKQAVKLGMKGRVCLRLLIFIRQFPQRIHQRLGNKHAPEAAEVTMRIRKGG